MSRGWFVGRASIQHALNDFNEACKRSRDDNAFMLTNFVVSHDGRWRPVYAAFGTCIHILLYGAV
ncbi:TPA: hypothetical protein SMP34_003132 [Proteus mirabilis]|nr:hypothetical protein [Proteus mirabilis]